MAAFPNPPLAPESIVAGQALKLNDAGDGWVVFTPEPGLTTLSLYYNDQGPFDFLCWGLPANWFGTEGQGSIGTTLEIGAEGNIASGVLLDSNGDAIPDGWIFPAILFVEGNTIFDIVAFNAYIFGGAAGIVSWGQSGGEPTPLNISGGLEGSSLSILNLPGSDPAVAGQVWSNAGVLTVSAG